MPDVSIAISATDNYSTTLKKMESETNTFKTNVTGLQEKLDKLNSTKAKMKVDLTDAKKELSEAKKAYEDLGDEASRTAYEMAQQNYDNVASNLKAVTKAANEAQKGIDGASGSMAKFDNRAGSGSDSNSTLSKLAQAGLYNMVGQSVSALGSTLITSAFGSEEGGVLNSVISSAVSGAAIGSVVPGVGTAIGAAVGGLSGLISGATSVYEARDSAFKEVVSDLYSTRAEEQSESLSNGSSLAGARETSKISFSTLLGSEAKADEFLTSLVDMANRTPFMYDDLTSMAKTMLAYNVDQNTIMSKMQAIGDTGAALGWSTTDMTSAATYLGRMTSTGKTSLEYLNPLVERGVDVWSALADGLEVSSEKAQEMVNKGLVPGAEAAEMIYTYLGQKFAGSMEDQSKTFEGISSTLEGLEDEMDVAMGEGYNSERMKGLNAQVDWLSGESGEQMKEANRLIGEWEASLENEKEETIRQYMQDALDQIEAEGLTGAEAGEKLAVAKSEAEAAYMAGEGYQTYLSTQTSIINSLQSSDEILGSWQNFGYTLSLELSKGMASGLSENLPGILKAGTVTNTNTGGIVSSNPYISPSTTKSNAWGLDRVPYDNYLTYLHEGERVLTAQEARQADSGSGGVVVQLNGTLSVREEADVEKIASAIYRKMQRAQEEAV